jgi:hypothetical protein
LERRILDFLDFLIPTPTVKNREFLPESTRSAALYRMDDSPARHGDGAPGLSLGRPIMRTVNALVLAAALLAGSGSFLGNLSSFFSALWDSSSSVDGGCELDPWGGCKPAPTQDAGCEIDPDGKPICSPAGS